MQISQTKDLLLIALAGGALYLVWKAKEKIKEGVDDFADAIAAPIADAYLNISMPGAVTLTGIARFPNGYNVPMSKLSIDPDTLTFTHLGVRYKIDHREGDFYIVVRA